LLCDHAAALLQHQSTIGGREKKEKEKKGREEEEKQDLPRCWRKCLRPLSPYFFRFDLRTTLRERRRKGGKRGVRCRGQRRFPSHPAARLTSLLPSSPLGRAGEKGEKEQEERPTSCVPVSVLADDNEWHRSPSLEIRLQDWRWSRKGGRKRNPRLEEEKGKRKIRGEENWAAFLYFLRYPPPPSRATRKRKEGKKKRRKGKSSRRPHALQPCACRECLVSGAVRRGKKEKGRKRLVMRPTGSRSVFPPQCFPCAGFIVKGRRKEKESVPVEGIAPRQLRFLG